MRLDEEDLECDLLELEEEGILEGARLELWHFVENLDLADIFVSIFPVALVEGSSSEDDVVTTVLGHKLNTLGIILIDELTEVATDHILVNGKLVLTDVWNFKQHGGGHEDAVEDFEVNLKMRGDEALLLFELFLKGLLLVPAVGAQALGETLLELGALADVDKDLEALLKESKSEGSETDLDDGSVVADLVGDLLLTNDVRDTCLHHEVLRLEISVVDGVVIHIQ